MSKPKDKTDTGRQDANKAEDQERLDEKLDEALEETFPASDPVAVTPSVTPSNDEDSEPPDA